MIYTVTFNPSLDYIISIDDMKLGIVNRTKNEMINPGGKGVNVSMVLENLGIDSVAIGFLAGTTGDMIEKYLVEKNIDARFVHVSNGMSRINVKLRNEIPGILKIEETEINGAGPNISCEELKAFYELIDKLESGDMLVLAGSIPNSLPDSIYMDIMKRLEKKNIDIVVDATNKLLLNVLECRPFLVKPNDIELGEMFDVKIDTKSDAIKYARELAKMGARNVLVSMAAKGAVLVTEKGDVFESDAPKGIVVNSVGAGDSMIAGFLTGYIENAKSFEYAFHKGICTGSASAFGEGFASKEDVNELMLSMNW